MHPGERSVLRQDDRQDLQGSTLLSWDWRATELGFPLVGVYLFQTIRESLGAADAKVGYGSLSLNTSKASRCCPKCTYYLCCIPMSPKPFLASLWEPRLVSFVLSDTEEPGWEHLRNMREIPGNRERERECACAVHDTEQGLVVRVSLCGGFHPQVVSHRGSGVMARWAA